MYRTWGGQLALIRGIQDIDSTDRRIFVYRVYTTSCKLNVSGRQSGQCVYLARQGRMTKQARAARAAYGTYSRTREQAAQQTRQAILVAAQGLFAKQGYGPTGIGQIAAAAGISRQTFYLHFPSKNAVLAELIVEFERGVMKLYEELAALPATVPDLAAWSRRFLEFCESDRKTVLLLLTVVPTELDVAQDRADLYQRIMSALGRTHPPFAAAATGDDPILRGRAVSLLAQVESLPRLAINAVPLCDRDALIEALAGNLMDFLSSDMPGRKRRATRQ